MECKEYEKAHCARRSCSHLAADHTCAVPENKPIECRFYPLDLAVVGDILYWILWPSCPYHKFFNTGMMVNLAEAELAKAPEGWLDRYISSRDREDRESSIIVAPSRAPWRPAPKENP